MLASFLFPRRHLALAFPLPSLNGSSDLCPKGQAHLSGGIAVPVRNIQVRAVFHQDVDERHIAPLKWEEDGHLPVPVLCVHVCALFQQHFRDLGVPDRRRTRVMKRRVARNVRDVRWRARGDEIAENIEVSHGLAAWGAGLEPLCTEDGKGDESELEGRLGGVQIRRGARFDILGNAGVRKGQRFLQESCRRGILTDLLDYVVIPAHTCKCKPR
jgi:hypothetical protein